MHPIHKFKAQQKELAKSIRHFKKARKQTYTGPAPTRPEWVERWGDLSEIFRIRHIAYCELRGRSREEVESRVRDEEYVKYCINPAVEKLKEQLTAELEAWRAEQEKADAA